MREIFETFVIYLTIHSIGENKGSYGSNEN